MNSLIESATKQVLSENLGFDPGRVYYLILTNQKKEIEKEFSYSKKYRILKSLFELGALSKIKLDDKDFYSYFPLPPLFLKESNEVSEFLNKLYEKNFKDKLRCKFFQVIMKTSSEKFVNFLKKFYIDTNNDKLTFEFNKIRCKDGHEYIGSIKILE